MTVNDMPWRGAIIQGGVHARGVHARVCQQCEEPFSAGFTDEKGEFTDGPGSFYACEGCFDHVMNEMFPSGWRANEHEDDPCWAGGTYEAWNPSKGEFADTGIHYEYF